MLNLTFLIFISCFIIQLIFWLGIYRHVSFYKNYSKNSSFRPFVTVIVVFKNEANNLKEIIPLLLNQSYTNYDLLLMNDFSDDGSAKIISSFQSELIKLCDSSENHPGKKFSLKEAISKAKGKYLLVTDADCRPREHWIKSMVGTLSEETDLVLGYGPMKNTSGLTNLFARYETWHTAVQYFSFALLKIPFMGVGRNMLIRKASLNINKLYADSKSISGDDDLLVQSLANSTNTSICIDPRAFIYSDSVSSISDYIKQKTRHVSSSWEYKWYHKLLLFLYGASAGIIPICLIILVFFFNYYLSLWVFLCLLLIKWLIAIPAMKKLKEESLILSFPILDLTYSLYYWILLILMLIKPKKW